MAIADELTKLETNRANIVAAINNKGGELAENAGLAACPEAIAGLSGGSESSETWTGHVDEQGLRYIGWNDEDIALLKKYVCWNAEQDADYAVPQDHKDLWDACEKVVVDGRTMLNHSDLAKFKALKWCRYLPMFDFTGGDYRNSMFEDMIELVAMPIYDLPSAGYVRMISNCKSLVILPFVVKIINNPTAWHFMTGVTQLRYVAGFLGRFGDYREFASCSSLREIPQLDTSSVTNMQSMFYSCSSLREIPQLDTSSVTNMQSMFSFCSSLREIPQLDTSSVTNMQSMFYSCSSLREIPQLDTSSVTNMQSMFSSCSSLREIPLLDTSSVTNMQSMFYSCSSLREIPLLDTSSVTNMQEMFRESAIKEIAIDMSAVTNLYRFHYQCYFLRKVKYTFTKSLTNCSDLFYNTRKIDDMEIADTCSLAGVTSANNMFANSTSNSIPKGCVNYTLVKQVCEMMLRGIPNYTADSYPMYFESGSAVTDDAAGTLQSLVEQCQAMGWAIYNLTINPA